MAVDIRHFPGQAFGPVRELRKVTLNTDFLDPRGFIWQCEKDGDYTFRPAEGAADLTLTLKAGEFPNVGGIHALCVAVRAGTDSGGNALSIVVANL